MNFLPLTDAEADSVHAQIREFPRLMMEASSCRRDFSH